MKARTILTVTFLALLSFVALGADLSPYEQAKMVLDWTRPQEYPRPIIEGMDLKTMNLMLEAGNLQWYEPRPEPDTWNGVVGQKIHAPLDVVWAVVTDYELQCKIMPETFRSCKVKSHQGNKTTMVYQCQTSVVMYSYDFEMVDEVVEQPEKRVTFKTIEGGLKGREVEIILVPVDEGAAVLAFIRYYGAMESLGKSMWLALQVMPMVEPPTTVGAANYHLRACKNEAERRAGFKAPEKPPDLEIDQLEIPTLRRINQASGGLIRETPAGKLIDVTAWTFIDAPPARVWEVASDFEHYNDFFQGSENTVESRDGNTVYMYQTMANFSLLVFDFGYELHSKYTLDPPHGFTYRAVDGLYEGSYGKLEIRPIEGGHRTLLFSTAKLNLDRDTGLVASIIKSGAFPVENMLNLLGVQFTLVHIKLEAEKREKANQ